MRSTVRTLIVLALAALLLGLFLRNVDVGGVAAEIVQASPLWLLLAVASTLANLALRSWRWQYLLEPLGHAGFGTAFRATAVGFAANTLLPARAGEIIRPYFLARQQRVSATGAFATIILERVLDMLSVLALLAAYVLFFGARPAAANPVAFATIKWAGVTVAAGSVVALAVLFVLAGHPSQLQEVLRRLERVLPSTLAGLLARVVEKFASGLAVVRRPGRLLVAFALSLPLWLSITVGIWSVSVAFDLAVPFTGSFLILSFLVIGVAVPTPGAVGGFHEAFRWGATTFFDAPETAAVGAAIVLHVVSFGPSLLLGLVFAAHEGLNLAGMRRMAEQAEPRGTA